MTGKMSDLPLCADSGGDVLLRRQDQIAIYDLVINGDDPITHFYFSIMTSISLQHCQRIFEICRRILFPVIKYPPSHEIKETVLGTKLRSIYLIDLLEYGIGKNRSAIHVE